MILSREYLHTPSTYSLELLQRALPELRTAYNDTDFAHNYKLRDMAFENGWGYHPRAHNLSRLVGNSLSIDRGNILDPTETDLALNVNAVYNAQLFFRGVFRNLCYNVDVDHILTAQNKILSEAFGQDFGDYEVSYIQLYSQSAVSKVINIGLNCVDSTELLLDLHERFCDVLMLDASKFSSAKVALGIVACIYSTAVEEVIKEDMFKAEISLLTGVEWDKFLPTLQPEP